MIRVSGFLPVSYMRSFCNLCVCVYYSWPILTEHRHPKRHDLVHQRQRGHQCIVRGIDRSSKPLRSWRSDSSKRYGSRSHGTGCSHLAFRSPPLRSPPPPVAKGCYCTDPPLHSLKYSRQNLSESEPPFAVCSRDSRGAAVTVSQSWRYRSHHRLRCQREPPHLLTQWHVFRGQ
jgi:hypothetical protein